MTTQYLYGIHDREGAHILPPGGWCVDVRALSENPPPTDYAKIRNDINWIVRLQWGFGTTGNIPLPHQFDHMVTAAAAYVRNSHGANIYIIGNEPNHEQERPDGVYITPEQYARCFAMCRNAIKQADPNAQVIPAPCAPYHANPFSWLDYWREMLSYIAANGGCDGLAVHAYTRSSKPEDITSTAKMGPPLERQYSGFWTYLDALDAVPVSMALLPVFITEFNELIEGGWHDANTGVVQAAYADVHDTNNDGNPDYPIQCLILYRWPKYDKWHIEGKQGVIDDFRAAVSKGYTSPTRETNAVKPLILAVNSTPPAPQPSLPPRDIDPRATRRGVNVITPRGIPLTWRVKSVQWYNEQEADRLGPDHHIMVDVLDEQGKRLVGVPLLVGWPSDEARILTEAKPGEPYSANYPMSPSRNDFSIIVDGLALSEVVSGIGMGMDTPSGFNAGMHTSTGVVFQRVGVTQAPTIVSSGPQPVTPFPTAVVTAPSGANIRTGPGKDYPVRGAEPFGTTMRIIGRNADSTWLLVDMPHAQGWVSFRVVETRNTANVPVVTVEAPQPVQPTPAPVQGDKWQRSIAFVLKEEGGLSTDPNDPGNYVDGKFIGTKYGISANAHPGVNIVDLTVEQAKDIYFKSYWIPSGASQLPFPMCLAVMDLAVNGGVGRAKEALNAEGHDFVKYMAWRIAWYCGIPNFDRYGRAWIKRCSRLMVEATR